MTIHLAPSGRFCFGLIKRCPLADRRSLPAPTITGRTFTALQAQMINPVQWYGWLHTDVEGDALMS